MILTKLKEYADRRMPDDLPPPMYGRTSVAWYVNLSLDGEFEGFSCLKTKEAKRGISIVAPHIGRTVGVKPKLLADTGEYVLGIGRVTSKPERVVDCHEQFKALIKKCAEESQEASLRAVVEFLNSSQLDKAKAELPKDFDPSEVVTFRVGNIVPADADYQLHQVESFWATYTSASDSTDESSSVPVMTCLITGEEGVVEKRLPFLIKGLIGGQPSGTALVSANSQPFMSYGLQNSLTSPISRDAAERFAKALNSLIADTRSRIYIGSTLYVFWTKDKTEEDFLFYLNQPNPEQVKTLLESYCTAQPASSLTEEKANQFYALALTANNARAVVRDWLETTVPNVRERLVQWFQYQRIVDPYGGEPRWFGVKKLAQHLYRRDSKDQPTEDFPARTVVNLIRNALQGDRIPEDLLVKLVRRNRTEREITYPRAVLMKLIFSSDLTWRSMMTNMEQLNSNPNLQGNDLSAYACGRLLAVLEATQRSAIGSVNASLTDRYYGAASSTPANAFPPLLKGARAHFSKLRKTMPGACKALEERVEEITESLPTFPKTLNLQQQGLFGLGYYHQRASDRAAAKARRAASKA